MKKIITAVLILCLSGFSAMGGEYELPPGDNGEITVIPEDPGETGNTEESEDAEEPENPDEPEEPSEYDFYDDMADSSKMLETSDNVVFSEIPENQYGEFYDDYTIVQRMGKGEEYIIYDLPYWTYAEITAYFYNGEEINHFIFSASSDGKAYTEIECEPDVISEDGKWHKVTYKIPKAEKSQRYLKISWQNLSDTDFSNWGQSLGDIKVKNEASEIYEIKYLSALRFALPDSGETVYTLETEVCDQMGAFLEETVLWHTADVPGTLKLDENGILTVYSDSEADSEYEFTAYIEGSEINLTVTLAFMHFKPGDVNSDFEITIDDLKAAGGFYLRPLSDDEGIIRGDINKNGIIDIYDLAYISYNIKEGE